VHSPAPTKNGQVRGSANSASRQAAGEVGGADGDRTRGNRLRETLKM
jgi:hypothetical protein